MSTTLKYSSSKPFKPLVNAQTSHFAVGILQRLFVPEHNLVVSPFVVASQMVIALPGADGDTRAQLLETLFGEKVSSREKAKEHFDQFVQSLAINTKVNKNILSIVNLAYLKKGVPLSQDYATTLLEHLKVVVKNFDLTQNNNNNTITVDIANTAFKNDEMRTVELNLSPDDCFVLLSGIHFAGQWNTPLHPRITKLDGDFHQDNGQTVKTAIMFSHNSRPYYRDQSSDTQAVSLLYRTKYDYHHNVRIFTSLVLILPAEGTKMDKFVQSFTGAELDNILSGLSKDYQVKLRMPRFKIDGDHSLKSCMQALGIVDVFEPEKAQLPNIVAHGTEDRVFISQMGHSALFACDEKGSLVSTAAQLQVPPESSGPRRGIPVDFIADRPFLYAVVANSRPKQILFIGAVTNFSE